MTPDWMGEHLIRRSAVPDRHAVARLTSAREERKPRYVPCKADGCGGKARSVSASGLCRSCWLDSRRKEK